MILRKINLMFFILLVYFSTTVVADDFTIFDRIYGNYNSQEKCWEVIQSNSSYCMKIIKSNTINTKSGKRKYIVLAGDKTDGATAHPTGGMVSFYIIDLQNNSIIASKAMVEMGSFGSPPDEWKIVKIGPDDYWGWMGSDSKNGQGIRLEHTIIFAPYGKRGIKKIAYYLSHDSNDGAVEEHSKSYYYIKAMTKIDNTQINSRVFPLEIIIKGKKNRRKLPKKEFNIPFNTKKWEYSLPRDWNSYF